MFVTRLAKLELIALGYGSVGEFFGRGAFGFVFRAMYWTTGDTVAVKQVRSFRSEQSYKLIVR